MISPEKVTIAVITYNGEHLLEECISAIKSQDYSECEIMVVDNNSTDQSVDLVKARFPEVKVLRMEENRGPSPARNVAIRKANTRYILLVDDDAVLAPDCVRVLMDAVGKFPKIAVWAPRVIYYGRRDVIQYDGASLHYIGEAIINNSDTRIERVLGKEPFSIDTAGGVAYIVDKEKALQVGLFDEDYFFGKTDTEFTFRLTISGFRCLNVPRAVVYHKVKKRGLTKAFYQIRNRWFLILRTYSLKTILLILPSLLLYEISVLTFLAWKGTLSEYVRANLAVLKDFKRLMNKRRRVQALKKLSDGEVLEAGDFYIRGDLIKKKFLRLAKNLLNCTLNSYWRVVRNFI